MNRTLSLTLLGGILLAPVFAGTITFTDLPNDAASVVSVTGFGTLAQGVVTGNSCIDSHLIVTGSAWQCTVSVTAPAGGSNPQGGPFMTNFYEGSITPANLEATLINSCSNSGCTSVFTTDDESGTLAPFASGLNLVCQSSPSTVCTNAAGTGFTIYPIFAGDIWTGTSETYRVGVILPDDAGSSGTPEPSSILLGSGGLGLIGIAKLRKHGAPQQ